MENNKEDFIEGRVGAGIAAGYLFLIGIGVFTVVCVGMSIAYGGDPGGIIGILGVAAIIFGIRGWRKSLKERIIRDRKYFKSLDKQEPSGE